MKMCCSDYYLFASSSTMQCKLVNRSFFCIVKNLIFFSNMIDVWSYGLVFGITLGSYCYNRIYAQLQTTNSSCTPPSPLEHVRTAHSTRLVPACNGHTQAQLACQLLTASMHMGSRPSIDRSRSRMHRRTVRASRCAIIFRSQGEIDVYVHARSHVCVCNRLDNWVVHYSFEALY